MTIYYCSWATGNDSTGDGSYGNPWKTITKASTGLTGGDEVRVEKSPAPTALTGTLTFTAGSANVSGSGTAFTTELVIGDFIEADGTWWEVVTIGSATSATLYQKYSGAAAAGISSRKLGVTSTGAAAATNTQVQVVSASGTSAAPLLISGGWTLATQAQDGLTWFRQMHATFDNRYGFGLYCEGKTYVEASKLAFLRYDTGVYLNNGANICTVTDITCNSNATAGIYFTNSNNSTATNCICNSNATYGINVATAHNSTLTNCTCRSNVYGVNTSTCMNFTVANSTCIANAAGFFFSATTVAGKNITTALNTSGAIGCQNGTTILLKGWTLSEAANKKVINFTNFSNGRVSIGYANGNNEVWTDGGNIISQDATAGGTGKEWRFNVTSANRSTRYPLGMKIAAVAVAANAEVTVTVYFKKSATSIAGRLLCRGGQLAGVASDVSTTCPDDTSRNNVQIQFTPTEAGVIEIEAEAWWVSATDQNVIIDDIAITQA